MGFKARAASIINLVAGECWGGIFQHVPLVEGRPQSLFVLFEMAFSIRRIFASRKRLLFPITLLLLAGGALGLLFLKSRPTPSPPVERILQYRFFITNLTNRSVSGVTFSAFAPLSSGPFQNRQELTSSLPFTLGADPRDNPFLHFQLPPLAPFGQKEIRVTARLLMFPSSGRIDFRPPPSSSLLPVAPEIAALAQQVAVGGEGDTAKRLFDWVTAHVRYAGASGRDRGALQALKSGKGDCTDMALLFSALCRAHGIPSRTVGGFVCERNTNLSAASYHNWAEFVRYGRWWIADLAQKRYQPDGAAYVAFHVEEEGEGARYQRFKLEGDQLRARMQ